MRKDKCALLFLVLLGLLTLSVFPLKRVKAEVKNWQKGFSVYPESNSDFASLNYRRSVYHLASIGANYVTLIIPYYQQNLTSSRIEQGWNTPSDESLIDGVNYAKSLGLKVMLKPHIETQNNLWRAHIRPENKQQWFNEYQTIILHYARIAAKHKVEMLCVGAELINLSSASVDPANTEYWLTLIEKTRQEFPGLLTYSANWGGSSWSDEKKQIKFWHTLDFVGLAAYYKLHGNSQKEIKQAWQEWNRLDIQPFQLSVNKPIIFTEIGYRSILNSTSDPWNYLRQGQENQEIQADAYDALFSFWDKYEYIHGAHFWFWQTDINKPNYDIDYTPQNKLAEKIIESWFKKDVNLTASDRISPPPELIIASKNVNIQRNKIEMVINLTNSGGPLESGIVNFEVYDSKNNRIFQKYHQKQNINSSENIFSFEWKPEQNGKYRIALGVFSPNWNINYFWQDDVALIDFAEKKYNDDTFKASLPISWIVNGPALAVVRYLQFLLGI